MNPQDRLAEEQPIEALQRLRSPFLRDCTDEIGSLDFVRDYLGGSGRPFGTEDLDQLDPYQSPLGEVGTRMSAVIGGQAFHECGTACRNRDLSLCLTRRISNHVT